jgi:hypothetical protein
MLHLEPRLLEVPLPDGDDVGRAHDRGVNAQPDLERLGLWRHRFRESHKASENEDAENSEPEGAFHGFLQRDGVSPRLGGL